MAPAPNRLLATVAAPEEAHPAAAGPLPGREAAPPAPCKGMGRLHARDSRRGTTWHAVGAR
eukprot:CAMPEP_0170405486 /NCGR_PEP_ID=MMETSP0117_2-20130122/27203_1 /TAXON_ID=400756 /ORGANISM="Durinskia baltica, Strain CSIRO CS-38" /LENGTH=60 /DNA_ID=CAMNT_0010662597 /DNA_START=19 /DNA_END=198 /DNA_ORIENTATION=+